MLIEAFLPVLGHRLLEPLCRGPVLKRTRDSLIFCKVLLHRARAPKQLHKGRLCLKPCSILVGQPLHDAFSGAQGVDCNSDSVFATRKELRVASSRQAWDSTAPAILVWARRVTPRSSYRLKSRHKRLQEDLRIVGSVNQDAFTSMGFKTLLMFGSFIPPPQAMHKDCRGGRILRCFGLPSR